ncbi:MAG: phosphoribosylformylglycinamidine synthase [Clostridium perfringens]|nr:phosphoribosylformylglycinamidine synthase [Clostridium perfringens]
MVNVFYVEKKLGFNVEAKNLLADFKENLSIISLENVRVINKYIVVSDKELDVLGISNILHEETVDYINDDFNLSEDEYAFGVEFLPGQYDQRAQSAKECYAILNDAHVNVRCAKIIILKGKLSNEDIASIKKYYINPVDSREVNPKSLEVNLNFNSPDEVNIIDNFINMSEEDLKNFHKSFGLAMTIEDLLVIKDYFKEEERNPSVTEIKVIDTYWSDHCRHTTFETNITDVDIESGLFNNSLKETFKLYEGSREFVYENKDRAITLMDIAVISMKEMRKRGALDDLDLSDEINACSINVKIETTNGPKDYLLMFKNETHNHPTEIEPFGGAATCLGGAIRDPLSGRTYVYQAMRVTGSADPRVSIEDTLKGKLPQRKITLGAAHGYSSYGNQIGLATGEVREIYHPGYVAKRMEIGAVLGATPKENVVREVPVLGDVIILLGGKTGRDGCGGATGSSKEHTEESIENCGAEVQKGNPPTERKIQRLFRNKEVSTLIKRCNDFGAGGVSVAIGELCDSLDINLDLVPKKYEGLDGTELAISESQERMAVVVKEEDTKKFIDLANKENLEATIVARVTDTGYMRMYWQGKRIVDLKRAFLNTNGAKQYSKVLVNAPKEDENFFENHKKNMIKQSLKESFESALKNLNITSQKGLVETFDSTIGSNTVLMPFGGKYQLTPAEGMACRIPVLEGVSETASLMANGFNPYLASWSPYHGAYYSVIESVTKIVAMGGKIDSIRLTLQEYFEKLYKNPERWGKPFSALLGAYRVQKDLNIPAIGGKDSMSGSFGDMDVPPSLVSFAVTTTNASNVISPEFKSLNSKIVFIKTTRNDEEIIDLEEFKKNMEVVSKLIEEKKVISAFAVRFGGVFEAISKMTFGNMIGAKIFNLTKEELFDASYGSLVLEVKENVDLEKEFHKANYLEIGETNDTKSLEIMDEVFSLESLLVSFKEGLSKVFKEKTKDLNENIENKSFNCESRVSPKIKIAKPKVIIPTFPGTNCEYDSARAFKDAGAKTKIEVFRNLNNEMLNESIKSLEKEIRSSQIIMIPGGFSAGDEPDGSGKFIATVFKNERIKDAVMDLLNNRDGLILGICNGFQALIKLGLVPFGEIKDITEDMPTLTYNNIGRHMSSIVRTKITSNLSPWFSEVNVGDIQNVAISHGEGRFVASEEVIKSLFENGQVATQYVDLEGKASMDMPFNPNGSMMAIEGITSLDGRVLGKMGHSERIGENLYKNIPGNFDQKIFESGVKYFK